ncbi:Arsenical resistance operon repressor [hydrothermal vent metagenome]|uniref:Arsenical resistance operon repressor n=1 Tax=hydrothermal vent metagenome TaxID=652676 RepID=A0A1W1CND7_9ZZZZ
MNDFFKVLSDETRLRCLILIYENNELCQSKISRHLSFIKLNKLIIDRREKQWVLYSPNIHISAFKKDIIKKIIKELLNISPFKEDRDRLLKMKNRPLINKGDTCV